MFKPGDKVVCIDDEYVFFNDLVKNEIYIVDDRQLFPGLLKLVNVNNPYRADRFRLAYIKEFEDEWQKLTSK